MLSCQIGRKTQLPYNFIEVVCGAERKPVAGGQDCANLSTEVLIKKQHISRSKRDRARETGQEEKPWFYFLFVLSETQISARVYVQ